MEVQEILTGARDALTVRRVYGEPYERNGVTVIPAAVVRGGAGGGGSKSDRSDDGGGGFGLAARPVGAYIIRDGQVSWQPALDLNRAILGGQIVVVVGMLVCRSVIRQRRKRKVALAKVRAQNG